MRRVSAGRARYNFDVERTSERYTIDVSVDRAGTPPSPSTSTSTSTSTISLIVAPALPLDAKVTRVTVGGRQHPFTIEREGDVQRVRVTIERAAPPIRIEIAHDAGTDVSIPIVEPSPGAASEGLRVLRVRAEGDVLRLLVEGRGQRTYQLAILGPRSIGASAGAATGVTALSRHGMTQDVTIRFGGSADDDVRQDLRLPLSRSALTRSPRR